MTKNKIFLTSILLFLLFPFSKSFGEATLTHVQTVIFDDESNAKSQNRQIAGIEFNKDGTKMFTSFANQACVMEDQTDACDSASATFRAQVINTYNLSTPYDISTQSFAGDSERCVMTDLNSGANFHTVYDLSLIHI